MYEDVYSCCSSGPDECAGDDLIAKLFGNGHSHAKDAYKYSFYTILSRDFLAAFITTYYFMRIRIRE